MSGVTAMHIESIETSPTLGRCNAGSEADAAGCQVPVRLMARKFKF